MFEVLTTVCCRRSVRNIAALNEKQADFQIVDVNALLPVACLLESPQQIRHWADDVLGWPGLVEAVRRLQMMHSGAYRGDSLPLET
jgi:hypothetical protein